MKVHFVVVSSGTRGSGAWGSRVRIAVVASTRLRTQIRDTSFSRIVRVWEDRYAGQTQTCQAAIARKEAEDLAAALARDPAARRQYEELLGP